MLDIKKIIIIFLNFANSKLKRLNFTIHLVVGRKFFNRKLLQREKEVL